MSPQARYAHRYIASLSLTKGISFSHRTHRFDRPFLRTISNSQKASGIQISQSVKTIVDTNKGQHKADILLIGVSRWSLPFPPGEGSGEGPLSLWAFVYSVHLCSLWEKEHWRLIMGRFFSHRTHRFNRAFLRTVSSPQNASGIQISQNVIAKGGCNVLWYRLT